MYNVHMIAYLENTFKKILFFKYHLIKKGGQWV